MNFAIRCGWGMAFYVAGPLLSIAADWPVYQQNNQRNAKSIEKLDTSRLSIVWSRQLTGPANPAWSGPAKWDAYAGIRDLKSMRDYDAAQQLICVGDRVWTGSSLTGEVTCLDLQRGELVWKFHSEGPVRTAPSYAEGQIYFGSDDGFAYCLDAESGELVWRSCPRPTERRVLNNGRLVSLWPVRTGVLVYDGRAFFGASLFPWAPSYLCAVNAATGAQDSPGTFTTELERVTLEGPMSVAPGRYLISPQGRVAPRLFSLVDGQAMGPLKGGGGSFVVLTKDSVFHGPGNKTGWLTASSLESLETVASYRNGNAIVVAGDVSFILTDDSLSAANYVTREELWSTECDCPLAMILAGDQIFVGGVDRVRAYDVRTGEPLWQSQVPGQAFALAVANGHLLVGTDTGYVTAFASQDSLVTVADARQHPVSTSGEMAVFADLRPVDAVRDPTMKDRWVFQWPHAKSSQVDNLAGGQSLNGGEDLRMVRERQLQAVQLLQTNAPLVVTDKLDSEGLPRSELTASAWVRVDQPTRHGGIVGCMQDNGDYRQGWSLGL